jgi:hypothetical protein
LLVAHLHAQPAAGRSDGQVPVAESPHQVEGLSRGLLEREALGIRGSARGYYRVRSTSFDRLKVLVIEACVVTVGGYSGSDQGVPRDFGRVRRDRERG